MCTSIVLQMIENEVSDRVQKNEMFTVFDITKAVRAKSGPHVNIRHDEVRQEINDLYNNNRIIGYSRTIGNLPNVSVQPMVYHHFLDDPSDYGAVKTVPQLNTPAQPALNDIDALKALPPGNYNQVTPVVTQHVDVSKPVVRPFPTASTPKVAFSNLNQCVNTTKVGVDSRKTLCIPKSYLKQLFVNPGDTVGVYNDSTTTKIVKYNPSSCKPLSTYTVDKYGNVRITQATLQRAGLAGSEYYVDFDINTTPGIILRKAA